MQEMFALTIIRDKDNKKFQFKAKSRNINVFEVFSLLRRYCDELEKKFLDDIFKNVTFEIGYERDNI